MAGEEKLDWIYKNANSLVNREDYLVGRKVDKALEQLNEDEKEKKIVLPTPKNHVEHECIPPSIRDFNKIVQAEQVDLSAKLQEDPLVTIRKREEEARRQFLQNPVQLKKLQDALEQQEKKKKKNKSKQGYSDTVLDERIKGKMKYLKNSELDKKTKKKVKKDALDTILMHKFNALKDKLSDSDLNDILNGKINSSSDESVKEKKKKKRNDSSNSCTDSEDEEYSKSKERACKMLKKNQNKEIEKYGKKYEHSKNKVERKNDKYQRSRSRSKNRFTNKNKTSRKHSSDSKNDSSDYYENKSKCSYKNKHSHKRKSSRTQSSDSSDEKSSKRYRKSSKNTEKDLDEKIMEKLRILRHATEIATKNKKQSNNSCKIQNEDEEEKSKKLKDKEIKENNISSLSDKHLKRVMLPEKPAHLIRNTNSSDSSSSDQNSRRNSNSEEERGQKRTFGLVSADGKKIAISKTNKAVFMNKKSKKIDVLVKAEKKVIKKLTEDEKEKLRKEMMQNAEIRDKEREENLRKYRENEKQEESKILKYDTSIIHNQLLKTAKHASIEDRIKSNLNNIQRSSRHMDTNFSKR